MTSALRDFPQNPQKILITRGSLAEETGKFEMINRGSLAEESHCLGIVTRFIVPSENFVEKKF